MMQCVKHINIWHHSMRLAITLLVYYYFFVEFSLVTWQDIIWLFINAFILWIN